MSLYYKLKIKEYVYLIILLAIGYIFTVTQKYYIPEIIRPFTLAFVFIAIFTIFHIIIKQEDPRKLSDYLSFLTFAIVLLIVIIQHIIIKFDISYNAVIILIASYLAPIPAYLIYKIVKKKCVKNEY